MDTNEIKKVIDSVECYDFAILETKKDNWILILVCKTEDQSFSVFNLINTTAYKIAGFAKDEYENYTIVLFFDNDLKLICRSAKKINEYPPIHHLESKKVAEITAGVEDGFNPLGEPRYLYNKGSNLPFSGN